tara:strand:- start:453 stop:638 length:186 start_codon:yes stop_codon:yes gene_type:complete
MKDTRDFKVGDKVSVTGDLKMGTVSQIIKESGEAYRVKVDYGDGATEWYMAEEVRKLLLEW